MTSLNIVAHTRTDLALYIRIADPFQSGWSAHSWMNQNRRRITVGECPEWLGEDFDLA